MPKLAKLFCFAIAVLLGVMIAPRIALADDGLAANPNFDPADIKIKSPLIISGYGIDGPSLKYVQLFNDSDELIDLSGWKIQLKISGQTASITLPDNLLSGLIEPGNFVVISQVSQSGQSFVQSADFGFSFLIPPELSTARLEQIDLLPPGDYFDETAAISTGKTTNLWTRNRSTSTGNFLSTFREFKVDEEIVIFGKGLYQAPLLAEIQISSIMPNAKKCAPSNQSVNCLDFVKLHNPTAGEIDLSDFRLRNGFKGQSATSSNTFNLSGKLAAGGFKTIAFDSGGHLLSIDDSGGFVWLEDRYGLELYENTETSYPSAGAVSKVGTAWAYDENAGDWKWTNLLNPIDGENVFPELTPETTIIQPTSELTPCEANQYRSLETNRCRLISTTSEQLIACDADQYRSPETNRCRSLATAASVLVPCESGQERNADTNRCRSILGASTSLQPCGKGQTRNPETNRCRNSQSSTPIAEFAVEPIKQGGKAFVGWWALGGLGVLAAGYGIWEWRSEMMTAVRKVGSFFTSGK